MTFSAGSPELDNWDYLEIDHSYPIYDFNDNIEGFVYELVGDDMEGFILVSNHDSKMKVTRASAYNSFEYIEELQDGETLYSVNTRTFYTKEEESEFTELETGTNVSINDYESKSLSLVTPRGSIAYVGEDVYRFIDSY